MLLPPVAAPWLLLLGLMSWDPAAGAGTPGHTAERGRGQRGAARVRTERTPGHTAERGRGQRGAARVRTERRPETDSGAVSPFGVRFHKCAQVKLGSDPPEVSFFLLIQNQARTSDLSQVSVRDSISGLVLLRSEGREVERGFQSFTIDALLAGAEVVLNYSAHVTSAKSGVLELPAFLTFSNTSQNDVSMFGPLTTNLTLRMNSSHTVSPNHALHVAGFVGGFVASLGLVLSVFLIVFWIDPSVALRLRRRKRNAPEAEFGDAAAADDDDTFKDEALFENKMVDVMILEEPQNMVQALQSLEVASLLRAAERLETLRLQLHRALVVALLGGGGGEGRLLEVVQGQAMAAEGRLKEQLEDKMAALAARCNRESRDAMEAELQRQREERERAEQLCQRAEQQMVVRCSLLLEKLHKDAQSRLQRHLLVRHEEASARVHREVREQRRAELHTIFCEELEEATRLGEMDQRSSNSLQHQYFTCQDLLEDMLDEVVAHQRFVLSQRQAERSVLVQNLQSLHSLVPEMFSSCSRALDDWLSHVRRLGCVPVPQMEAVVDRAQQQGALLRRRVEEALTEEKTALRSGLIQTRKEQLCTRLRLHRQQMKVLLSAPLSLDGAGLLQMFETWKNLVVSQSSEFSELIRRLDEEAAADITKVTRRLLEGTAAELRDIQPSVVQSLQAALPPGERHLLLTDRTEPALTHTVQEEHQNITERLQEVLQRELREQRQTRDSCRAFFRGLCSCQLLLSEAELLQMKLELLKCLSVMDRCLVLPPAVLRLKLHCALEQQTLTTRGKSGSSKQRLGSELQRFQKSLEERLSLSQRLKEQENVLRAEILEQMQEDRRTSLLAQAALLSSRLVSGQLEKVQRWSRAQQLWSALTSLQNLLIQELRLKDKMADSVLLHWEGLAAAEEQFHKDLSSLQDCPRTTDPVHSGSRATDPVHSGSRATDPVHGGSRATDPVSDCETGLFQLQPDCSMESVLQGALHKREQLLSALAQSAERWTSRTQVTQELKEQLEMRNLQQILHQELRFLKQLLDLAEVPLDVLREMLRLLLPSLSESELLSVTEKLQLPTNYRAQSSGGTELLVKLKETVIREAASETPAPQTEPSAERRRGLLQKLLPSAHAAPPPRSRSRSRLKTRQESGPSVRALSPGDRGDGAVRLFVFRDPPSPGRTAGGAARRRKRNFLNFKKNAVAPTSSANTTTSATNTITAAAAAL